VRYANILEEEVKNRVTQDFFRNFDCTKILGKIDFAVKVRRPSGAVDLEDEYLLWAEAKQKPTDIPLMLAQLVLTIGKARTFDEILPPAFLGCYDSEKIAFVPFSEIQEIFYQNDFNWNVAPSNHETKEFQQVYGKIKQILENDVPFETYLFYFEHDEAELKRFIHNNFVAGKTETSKIRIDKNNFINVYQRWTESVMPTIGVNWDKVKKRGLISGHFYLADLLSHDNESIQEKLFVLLKSNHYVADRRFDDDELFSASTIQFTDKQKAHNLFWAKYERPPLEEYWDYIIDRQDLLVPQDIRERKGSFYTPRIWVEKSQEYLAKTFGENWQDEYFVWDCCAGTGNLLAGLTNKYKIWASTLDKADVDVMKQRIENGANLLEDHVFQFDFLNDSFDKLPEELREIINNPKLRKRLIVYINPPYAEIAGKKTGVNLSKIHDKYHSQLSGANRELFAQFLIRIYNEIPDCVIAEFSKMKTLTGAHFQTFRENFQAKLEKAFIVPAWSFDNVTGKFPIGFKIWDTKKKVVFKSIKADIFDENFKKAGKHGFYSFAADKYFSKWVNTFKNKNDFYMGWLEGVTRNDFQAQDGIFITNAKEQVAVPRGIYINLENLIHASVCFAVRKVIPATWLNDRDQFLFPNKKWEKDDEFHNDCLAYTLFNNNISSKYGVNHWIPFKEEEVNARTAYKSHIIISFLSGKKVHNAYTDLFSQIEEGSGLNWEEGKKREFSAEAQAVFDAGRELWRYYHAQPNFPSFKNLESLEYNVNASLYDIREYFQGRNDAGKMNNNSTDEKYNKLIENLRDALRTLAAKIEPKVYEYGFLKD
jgi:hypothetical protein